MIHERKTKSSNQHHFFWQKAVEYLPELEEATNIYIGMNHFNHFWNETFTSAILNISIVPNTSYWFHILWLGFIETEILLFNTILLKHWMN